MQYFKSSHESLHGYRRSTTSPFQRSALAAGAGYAYSKQHHGSSIGVRAPRPTATCAAVAILGVCNIRCQGVQVILKTITFLCNILYVSRAVADRNCQHFSLSCRAGTASKPFLDRNLKDRPPCAARSQLLPSDRIISVDGVEGSGAALMDKVRTGAEKSPVTSVFCCFLLQSCLSLFNFLYVFLVYVLSLVG